MSVVKSDLIRELANNYASFLKRDLTKLFEIAIYEMQEALKRGERVELRDFFSLEPKYYKPKFARNPRTNEKIYINIDETKTSRKN